jgi:hypothetical protein
MTSASGKSSWQPWTDFEVLVLGKVLNRFEFTYPWFDYQVIWHYHLIISDSDMWKRLQNVYSQIKQARLKPLSQPIWQPPVLHPFSYQPPTHRRILVFPVPVTLSVSSSWWRLLCHHKSERHNSRLSSSSSSKILHCFIRSLHNY